MPHLDLFALTINGTPFNAPSEIPQGGTDTLNKILANGISIALGFGVLFALYVLIRGGMEWTSSGGDKAKIEHARQRLIFGVVGLILLLSSILIIQFVFMEFNMEF